MSPLGGRGTWHQLPETSRSVLESRSIEGERPVDESGRKGPGIPSTTGHEKSCGNLRGPSRKAKYSFATDSELLPLGKGEKYSCKESEIVPETVYLQAVGVLPLAE